MTATLIAAPPYRSPAWHEWRRHGLGASDLPALLGCDPYQSEYGLASEKRGDGAERESTPLMKWGSRMESVGIEWYADTYGSDVVTGETFGDDRWPHLWASLDARRGAVGIEVKWAARWEELPRRVEVQALGQIGLASLDAVDVVRLSAYSEPTVHRVEREEPQVTDLLDLGEAWYVRYVLGDEMPAFDDSLAARRALGALRGTAEARATQTQAELMDQLRRVRLEAKRLEALDKSLVRDMKASMAGTGVLLGDGFRVAWSATKGRTTTAWQLVAEGLRTRVTPEEWDALVSIQTTTSDPGDRFYPTWTDEMEEAA